MFNSFNRLLSSTTAFSPQHNRTDLQVLKYRHTATNVQLNRVAPTYWKGQNKNTHAGCAVHQVNSLVRQVLQGRHVKRGRAHQICPSLAEAGAMTGAIPLLLVRIPLHKHAQECQAQAQLPGAGK